MMIHRSSVFIAVLASVGVGCSRDEFHRVQVEGVLTAGGKPLADVEVHFSPLALRGDKSHGVSGSDGSFRLKSSRYDFPGIVPGEYSVVVRPRQDPAEEDVPPEQRRGGAQNVEGIPAVYGSPEKTPLRVTIPAAGGKISVDIPVPSNRGKAR